MAKYKITESRKNVNYINNSDNITLHKNILDILFKHKEEVYKRLIDLRGIFLIDHIAIKIINPNNEITIFSITPSVEYNLIVQGLWKYDYGFSPDFKQLNKIHIWENGYSKEYFNEIKSIKELKHGFNFSFNLLRKQGAFNLIYSFATRSKNHDLFNYYNTHLSELSELGDYGYKLIHGIYLEYCSPEFVIPSITAKKSHPIRTFLKLVVNNK